eukprot:gnl/MRDRNA2_/MRDRNA2_265338_c0_seq1.p1 gnl/MRDRNA2_/MRDRNA2_265338_c0~~gnl/MRDRNA2_/MRDRNA2_265338_c0_seq1.p1  ORF type:complete len:124 (-),score=6.50 gnl/MRDRNA2_/MRDRNA2_265338_c0_seq1:256-627(-)
MRQIFPFEACAPNLNQVSFFKSGPVAALKKICIWMNCTKSLLSKPTPTTLDIGPSEQLASRLQSQNLVFRGRIPSPLPLDVFSRVVSALRSPHHICPSLCSQLQMLLLSYSLHDAIASRSLSR